MVSRTPLYGLPYIDPSDKPREIAAQEKAAMLLIEEILKGQGKPPVSSDLVSLVTRLNKVEAVVPDRKRLITIDSGVNGAAPAGATIIERVGAANVVVQGQLATITFPQPFPTQCTMILLTPNSGTAIIPVVNGGQLTRTGVTIYLPLGNGAAANVGYHAFGW